NLKPQRIDAATIANRKMPRRLLTGIKMLVKPVSRRTVNTALAPLDLYDLVLVAFFIGTNAPVLVPEQNVADGLQANDNGSRPMMVRLMIFAHGPFTQMTDKGITRHFKLAQAQPRTLDLETLQERIFDIGDEIRFPNVDQTRDVPLVADVEVVFLTAKPV